MRETDLLEAGRGDVDSELRSCLLNFKSPRHCLPGHVILPLTRSYQKEAQERGFSFIATQNFSTDKDLLSL